MNRGKLGVTVMRLIEWDEMERDGIRVSGSPGLAIHRISRLAYAGREETKRADAAESRVAYLESLLAKERPKEPENIVYNPSSVKNLWPDGGPNES